MKLIFENDKIILYLNKLYIAEIDFKNKEAIQKYLRDLFLKIKNIYDIEFKGYYDVNIFIDDNYGVVIEIMKDELEYFDYFGGSTDLNIKVFFGFFLYEVLDIEDEMHENFAIYNLDDRFYLKAFDDFHYDLGQLMEECTSVIYGYKARDILKRAVKI